MKTPELAARPQCLPAELLSSTLFLLGRVGFLAKGRLLAELDAAGASPYHYSVLARLAEGACAAQVAIADSLGLDRSQMVGILDALERQGLVERRRDPNDRRRHTVSLTADGKRQLVRLRAIVRKIEDALLEPLDDDARTALHETLYAVAAHSDSRVRAR